MRKCGSRFSGGARPPGGLERAGRAAARPEVGLHLRIRNLLAGACLVLALGGCSREQTTAGIPPRPDLTRSPAGLAVALAGAESAVARATRDEAAWLELGQIYHANGFYAEARACYHEVVARTDDSARAWYFLADIAASTGDMDGMMKDLEATLRLDPKYAPAHLLLAEARYKSGAPEAAVAGYEAVLRLDPANPSASVGIARERMRSGDDAGAATILEVLIAKHPNHSTGLSLLARLVDERGDHTRAAALREQARFRKDPPPADPWMDEVMRSCHDVQRLGMRFEDFVKSGRENDAWACLKQLEAVDPSNWIVCRIRGMAAEMRGHPEEAVREYERAVSAGGDASKVYPPLVASLIAVQRYADAEARAREGLRALPGSPALLVALADLRVRRGDGAEARRLLGEALSLEPQNVAGNLAMARIHWEAGDRDRAVPHLESVRLAAPSEIRARALLGQYHLDKDEPALAIAPLAEALAIDPRNDDLGNMLAVAHLRAGNRAARDGRPEEALRCYDEGLKVRPEMADIFANKVQVLLRLHQYEPAADALSQLATLRPANPAIFLSLGDIQHSAGKPAAAKASWQKALQLLGEGGDGAMRAALLARLESLDAR